MNHPPGHPPPGVPPPASHVAVPVRQEPAGESRAPSGGQPPPTASQTGEPPAGQHPLPPGHSPGEHQGSDPQGVSVLHQGSHHHPGAPPGQSGSEPPGLVTVHHPGHPPVGQHPPVSPHDLYYVRGLCEYDPYRYPELRHLHPEHHAQHAAAVARHGTTDSLHNSGKFLAYHPDSSSWHSGLQHPESSSWHSDMRTPNLRNGETLRVGEVQKSVDPGQLRASARHLTNDHNPAINGRHLTDPATITGTTDVGRHAADPRRHHADPRHHDATADPNSRQPTSSDTRTPDIGRPDRRILEGRQPDRPPNTRIAEQMHTPFREYHSFPSSMSLYGKDPSATLHNKDPAMSSLYTSNKDPSVSLYGKDPVALYGGGGGGVPEKTQSSSAKLYTTDLSVYARNPSLYDLDPSLYSKDLRSLYAKDPSLLYAEPSASSFYATEPYLVLGKTDSSHNPSMMPAPPLPGSLPKPPAPPPGSAERASGSSSAQSTSAQSSDSAERNSNNEEHNPNSAELDPNSAEIIAERGNGETIVPNARNSAAHVVERNGNSVVEKNGIEKLGDRNLPETSNSSASSAERDRGSISRDNKGSISGDTGSIIRKETSAETSAKASVSSAEAERRKLYGKVGAGRRGEEDYIGYFQDCCAYYHYYPHSDYYQDVPPPSGHQLPPGHPHVAATHHVTVPGHGAATHAPHIAATHPGFHPGLEHPGLHPGNPAHLPEHPAHMPGHLAASLPPGHPHAALPPSGHPHTLPPSGHPHTLPPAEHPRTLPPGHPHTLPPSHPHHQAHALAHTHALPAGHPAHGHPSVISTPNGPAHIPGQPTTHPPPEAQHGVPPSMHASIPDYPNNHHPGHPHHAHDESDDPPHHATVHPNSSRSGLVDRLPSPPPGFEPILPNYYWTHERKDSSTERSIYDYAVLSGNDLYHTSSKTTKEDMSSKTTTKEDTSRTKEETHARDQYNKENYHTNHPSCISDVPKEKDLPFAGKDIYGKDIYPSNVGKDITGKDNIINIYGSYNFPGKNPYEEAYLAGKEAYNSMASISGSMASVNKEPYSKESLKDPYLMMSAKDIPGKDYVILEDLYGRETGTKYVKYSCGTTGKEDTSTTYIEKAKIDPYTSEKQKLIPHHIPHHIPHDSYVYMGTTAEYNYENSNDPLNQSTTLYGKDPLIYLGSKESYREIKVDDTTFGEKKFKKESNTNNIKDTDSYPTTSTRDYSATMDTENKENKDTNFEKIYTKDTKDGYDKDGYGYNKDAKDQTYNTKETYNTKDYNTKDYNTKDYNTKDYNTKDYGTKDYGTKDYAKDQAYTKDVPYAKDSYGCNTKDPKNHPSSEPLYGKDSYSYSYKDSYNKNEGFSTYANKNDGYSIYEFGSKSTASLTSSSGVPVTPVTTGPSPNQAGFTSTEGGLLINASSTASNKPTRPPGPTPTSVISTSANSTAAVTPNGVVPTPGGLIGKGGYSNNLGHYMPFPGINSSGGDAHYMNSGGVHMNGVPNGVTMTRTPQTMTPGLYGVPGSIPGSTTSGMGVTPGVPGTTPPGMAPPGTTSGIGVAPGVPPGMAPPGMGMSGAPGMSSGAPGLHTVASGLGLPSPIEQPLQDEQKSAFEIAKEAHFKNKKLQAEKKVEKVDEEDEERARWKAELDQKLKSQKGNGKRSEAPTRILPSINVKKRGGGGGGIGNNTIASTLNMNNNIVQHGNVHHAGATQNNGAHVMHSSHTNHGHGHNTHGHGGNSGSHHHGHHRNDSHGNASGSNEQGQTGKGKGKKNGRKPNDRNDRNDRNDGNDRKDRIGDHRGNDRNNDRPTQDHRGNDRNNDRPTQDHRNDRNDHHERNERHERSERHDRNDRNGDRHDRNGDRHNRHDRNDRNGDRRDRNEGGRSARSKNQKNDRNGGHSGRHNRGEKSKDAGDLFDALKKKSHYHNK